MEHVFGGKFKLGKKIGSGSFGELYLGVNIHSGEEVAIKLLLDNLILFVHHFSLSWSYMPGIRHEFVPYANISWSTIASNGFVKNLCVDYGMTENG
ncbi:hypothetical protein Zm00014a_001598 [Zea mays]|uniref:Casein kinase I n=3 Tax=Zea mays TaxID=4577 RepID=A0A8J8XI62_MAIZE|nr:CBL-interacting serine/threonine-protein kinase 13 [Zea mays]AQK60489.1 ckl5 (Casein Kinase I-like 5) [Zea mays]PWZ29600.1 hypothetical protein Zm00014a_001598 [Zea mays]|eukprot:XP_020408519.1 CBL-interacting serine/threonine-protein kinase 13 [Zea mays]